MSEDYDLIVIGAGMAGVAAANKCGAAGWRVAIVDALPYGGTCALRGCDPKKILRRGAEIMDAARLMQGKGIDPGDLSINWADLMAHKRGFTDPVPDKMEKGLSGNGVETLHGAARFTKSNTLEVNGTAYQSERFLVAAGAMPRPLSFTGADLVIDSTDFLNLEALPERVLFIGGGFVLRVCAYRRTDRSQPYHRGSWRPALTRLRSRSGRNADRARHRYRRGPDARDRNRVGLGSQWSIKC